MLFERRFNHGGSTEDLSVGTQELKADPTR